MKTKKIYLNNKISEGDRHIVFIKPLYFEEFYRDDDYSYIDLNFGMEVTIPITKENNFILRGQDNLSTDDLIVKTLEFDLFHAFFHIEMDPNYTEYHWALKGFLKNDVILIEDEYRVHSIMTLIWKWSKYYLFRMFRLV